SPTRSAPLWATATSRARDSISLQESATISPTKSCRANSCKSATTGTAAASLSSIAALTSASYAPRIASPPPSSSPTSAPSVISAARKKSSSSSFPFPYLITSLFHYINASPLFSVPSTNSVLNSPLHSISHAPNDRHRPGLCLHRRNRPPLPQTQTLARRTNATHALPHCTTRP